MRILVKAKRTYARSGCYSNCIGNCATACAGKNSGGGGCGLKFLPF